MTFRGFVKGALVSVIVSGLAGVVLSSKFDAAIFNGAKTCLDNHAKSETWKSLTPDERAIVKWYTTTLDSLTSPLDKVLVPAVKGDVAKARIDSLKKELREAHSLWDTISVKQRGKIMRTLMNEFPIYATPGINQKRMDLGAVKKSRFGKNLVQEFERHKRESKHPRARASRFAMRNPKQIGFAAGAGIAFFGASVAAGAARRIRRRRPR